MDTEPPTCSGDSTALRLDADFVVHGPADTLLAAKVSLSGLDRHVSNKELDLLQFASGAVTQFPAGPPEVMRGELRNRNLRGIILHHVPDQALSDAFTPVFASAKGAPEHLAR